MRLFSFVSWYFNNFEPKLNDAVSISIVDVIRFKSNNRTYFTEYTCCNIFCVANVFGAAWVSVQILTLTNDSNYHFSEEPLQCRQLSAYAYLSDLPKRLAQSLAVVGFTLDARSRSTLMLSLLQLSAPVHLPTTGCRLVD